MLKEPILSTTTENILNPQQQQAVLSCDTPVCVLAAAGTGKTRTVVYRIHHLIHHHKVAPNTILGVTFTNKAAREMRERVEQMLPGVARQLWLGTFHSIAARALRRWGDVIGIAPTFLIYDEDDSKRLMRQISHEMFGMSLDAFKACMKQIGRWRNQGQQPQQVELQQDWNEVQQRALAIYQAYGQNLAHIGALDFNGLLEAWQQLLQHNAGRQHIGGCIQHLLVDEYQDTNQTQANIVMSLGPLMQTIAVVGDDDQSIYSFRGALSDSMQQFLDQMPNAKLIKLQTNYRSVDNILQAANSVIARNDHRINKTLKGVCGAGEKVEIVTALDDRHEAQEVVRRIEQFVHQGHALNDMAVLLRTNMLSRPFEEAFYRAQIPYKLVGGTRFYERKEIKDILATLRAALNLNSEIDFLRALSAVPRGIGTKTVQKVQSYAREHNIALTQLIMNKAALANCGVSAKATANLFDFTQQLAQLGQQAAQDSQTATANIDAHDAIVRAIEISGIATRLQQDEREENIDKMENIDQLLAAAKQYVKYAPETSQSADAQGFLETAALLSSGEEVGNSSSIGSLWLMTLHAAKGLEFPVVFMPAMEEFVLPHSHAITQGNHSPALQEERRLTYVGITRAKRHLTLMHARRRFVHGSAQSRFPSRFLRDIPSQHLRGDVPSYSNTQFAQLLSNPSTTDDEHIAQQPFAPGCRVWHNAFGEGTVLAAASQIGSDMCMHVRFDLDGKKRTVMASYLKPM
ncbi:MAG: UvrD-helicase domain-containing protein [Myxococcota bacterium]